MMQHIKMPCVGIPCAQKIFENDCACPVCEEVVSKRCNRASGLTLGSEYERAVAQLLRALNLSHSTVKLVTVLQGESAFQVCCSITSTVQTAEGLFLRFSHKSCSVCVLTLYALLRSLPSAGKLPRLPLIALRQLFSSLYSRRC